MYCRIKGIGVNADDKNYRCSHIIHLLNRITSRPYCIILLLGAVFKTMIKIKPVEFEKIIEATCDCCNKPIKVDLIGRLEDHLIIGGHYRGKLLDAIVCIACMEEKLAFINIQK